MTTLRVPRNPQHQHKTHCAHHENACQSYNACQSDRILPWPCVITKTRRSARCHTKCAALKKVPLHAKLSRAKQSLRRTSAQVSEPDQTKRHPQRRGPAIKNALESQSKPGTKMVDPEPCKELRRRPRLFMAGIVLYKASSTRVLIVAHFAFQKKRRWARGFLRRRSAHLSCIAPASKSPNKRSPGTQKQTSLPMACGSRCFPAQGSEGKPRFKLFTVGKSTPKQTKKGSNRDSSRIGSQQPVL